MDLHVDSFQIILVHTKLSIAILYKIAILAFAYFVFALFIVHCLVQWIRFLFFAIFPIHLLTTPKHVDIAEEQMVQNSS